MASNTGTDRGNFGKGPGQARKCSIAPKSIPHTWHSSGTFPRWVGVQLLADRILTEAVLRASLPRSSCCGERGENTFPAHLKPFSSVMLNEVRPLAEGFLTLAVLRGPFSMVNLLVLNEEASLVQGTSSTSAFIVFLGCEFARGE